jgi:hypothetical protein
MPVATDGAALAMPHTTCDTRKKKEGFPSHSLGFHVPLIEIQPVNFCNPIYGNLREKNNN